MNYPKEFNKIMEEVFKAEGGFVYDEDDPGGATNYGITIHTMRKLSIDLDEDDDIDVDDVRLLDKDKAKEIYWNEYWLGNDINKYPAYMRLILFDMTVNFGKYGAIKVLQRAINNKLGSNSLDIDGISGSNTISMAQNTELEVKRIQTFRIFRFCRIAHNNSKMEKFLHGWITRARKIG